MDPFILSKSFKIFPKWRNFAKSGHTGPAKVFFLLSRSHVRLIDRQKHVFATFHTIHRKEEFPPTPLSIYLENIFNFLLLFCGYFVYIVHWTLHWDSISFYYYDDWEHSRIQHKARSFFKTVYEKIGHFKKLDKNT